MENSKPRAKRRNTSPNCATVSTSASSCSPTPVAGRRLQCPNGSSSSPKRVLVAAPTDPNICSPQTGPRCRPTGNRWPTSPSPPRPPVDTHSPKAIPQTIQCPDALKSRPESTPFLRSGSWLPVPCVRRPERHRPAVVGCEIGGEGRMPVSDGVRSWVSSAKCLIASFDFESRKKKIGLEKL
uniref:Uncharacterized protein n=1 Tax=Opuntia streptacantha TaxID=393608 RepID=A0A7C9ECQ7_OPUST